VAGSRKDREDGSEEDLFEDLDQFFAPLEEWPEEEPAAGEQPAQAPPEDVDAAAVEAVEGDLEGLEIDIPDEEELVAEAATAAEGPTEPAAGPSEPEGEILEPPPDEISLSDLEVGDEELRAEEEEPAGLPGEPAAVAPPAGPGEEPSPGEEPDIEPESWDLGAEEDWAAAAEAEPFETPMAATEGPDAAGTGPPAGEEPPVTVDDLKAAPPEYASLPGPGEERPGAEEEEASVESLEDLEELPAAEGPEEEEAGAQITPPVEPEEEEEEEVAVAEAAADHFAEGIPPEEIERELLADLEQPGAQTVHIDSEGPKAAEPAPDEAAAAAAAAVESETAPTWQEEGAQPVGAEEQEPAPPARGLPGGRNLVAAFASGVVLAAAVIILLYIGKGPFAVFAGIVILAGQAEFYAVMRSRGYKPATLLGLVTGAFIIAGAYLRGDAAVLFGLFMAMGLGALWYMAGSPASRKETTANVAATLLGVVYVPVLASSAMLLLGLPGDLGRNMFLTVVGLTILYDVSAYAVGSWFGSRPLAPTISPSKSREGAIGATLILLFASFAVVPGIEPFTWQTAFGLGLVIAIAAPLGDLVESAFKRDLGVKDMGTILPGHGGVLDRIDAILFTAPAAYYFLRIIFF
jgi:phosphatidate cytidylyltransferase